MPLGAWRKIVEGLGSVIQQDALVRQYGALNFSCVEPDDLYVLPHARNGAIQVMLPIAVPQSLGGVSVDGVSFCSFIRSLKQKDEFPVTALLDPDGRVTLVAGASRCSFPRVDGGAAPVVPNDKPRQCGSINRWIAALNRVRYTTAKGRGTGVFCGVHVDEAGTLYSTDRYRCSRYSVEEAPTGPFTLPSDSIDYLVRQFSGVDEPFSYVLTDDNLVLLVSGATVVCSLLGGAYPPVGEKFQQVEQQEGSELPLSSEFREALDQHVRMQHLVADQLDRRTDITVGLKEIELLSRTPGSELRTKVSHEGTVELAFSINPESLAGRWDVCWVVQDGSVVRFSDERYTYMAICK